MSTITGERRRQIAELEKRIESECDWMREKQTELEDTLKLVENVQRYTQDLMSGASSSSARKRGLDDAVAIKETVKKYEEIVGDLQEAIRNKEEEIGLLQEEKRALESYEQGG